MTFRTDSQPALIALAVVAGLLAMNCERTPRQESQPASQPLSGVVTIEGSSTVFPAFKALTDEFQKVQSGVRPMLVSLSTADGFNKLCTGQLDAAAASRPVNAAEMRACDEHGIQFVELPIAYDSLSVVVNPKNTFVECLTTSELKRMWEPDAQGKVTRWSDIRSTFPPEPLRLVGPGSSSGTFDYFTLAIGNTQGRSRMDYMKSDDDTLLANAVAADPGALGYFGYAYYLENRERLKTVGIDDGRGCVKPSPQTVIDQSYQPLSRPLFLYVSVPALSRPEVDAFARFAVSVDHTSAFEDAGFVALPPVTLLTMATHLDRRVTGSVFGGQGAVLGVTADSFVDEERVKNALVR